MGARRSASRAVGGWGPTFPRRLGPNRRPPHADVWGPRGHHHHRSLTCGARRAAAVVPVSIAVSSPRRAERVGTRACVRVSTRFKETREKKKKEKKEINGNKTAAFLVGKEREGLVLSSSSSSSPSCHSCDPEPRRRERERESISSSRRGKRVSSSSSSSSPLAAAFAEGLLLGRVVTMGMFLVLSLALGFGF